MREPRTWMVDRFLAKTAGLSMKMPFRPPGLGDAAKVTNRAVPKGPQVYSQPNPPTPPSPSGLSAAQTSLPSPPVQ